MVGISANHLLVYYIRFKIYEVGNSPITVIPPFTF